mgnify:CR=1 FL=1
MERRNSLLRSKNRGEKSSKDLSPMSLLKLVKSEVKILEQKIARANKQFKKMNK